MTAGGRRAGVARPQLARQGQAARTDAGGIQVGQQRMKPEGVLVGGCGAAPSLSYHWRTSWKRASWILAELRSSASAFDRCRPPSSPGPAAAAADAAEEDTVVAVVMPELLAAHWWQAPLHNQTALLVKRALIFEPRVILSSVPFQLR